MKKLIFALLVIGGLLCFDNCYAFSKKHDYNYDIDKFDFDGTNGSIKGWAILNAGVNDESTGEYASPSLRTSWQSSDGYDYYLTFIGLNASGQTVSSYTYYDRGSGLDLTEVMCHKRSNTNECRAGTSPDYENVEFSFNFSVNDLNNNGSISKFQFKLKVESDGGVSKEFGLAFLDDAISSQAKEYFSSGQKLSTVNFVANTASLRNSSCDETGRTSMTIDASSREYEIKGVAKCGSLRWYKITHNGNTGWVPASWVVPATSISTLVAPKETCNVDGTRFNFSGDVNTPEAESCENEVSLSDSKSGTCTTASGTNYYSFTCNDYMEVEFIPSKRKYYRGDNFEITITTTSYAECLGTFNSTTWSNSDSSKVNKDEIKNNFLNFTLNSYNNNPTGYMQVSGRNVNLQITNNTIVTPGEKNVTYVNGNVPSSMRYTTNKRVITMELSGTVEVDSSRENTPYKIYINNLGVSSNSQAIYDCIIEKILDFYRPIDSTNPFISDSREIGENWLNDKYNFTNIIKSSIWNETPRYVFYVSRDNIKSIKQNNSLLGPSSYMGKECQILSNKMYCPFIRNTNYFSKIYIDGIAQ